MVSRRSLSDHILKKSHKNMKHSAYDTSTQCGRMGQGEITAQEIQIAMVQMLTYTSSRNR
jgi:hypothetical protein